MADESGLNSRICVHIATTMLNNSVIIRTGRKAMVKKIKARGNALVAINKLLYARPG